MGGGDDWLIWSHLVTFQMPGADNWVCRWDEVDALSRVPHYQHSLQSGGYRTTMIIKAACCFSYSPSLITHQDNFGNEETNHMQRSAHPQSLSHVSP